MPAPAITSLEATPTSRRTERGQQTRDAIVRTALGLASRNGLEGLTIGVLAERLGMSKSGVFAHFGSREDLQIAVVHEYHQRFRETVFVPALQAPRGLTRLRRMLDGWVDQVLREIEAGGCIFISGAAEYDDRGGPVRDALVRSAEEWRSALVRACAQAIEQGELRGDPHDLAFELGAIVLALQYDARFLKHPQAEARARRALAQRLGAA